MNRDKAIKDCWELWQVVEQSQELASRDMEWLAVLWQAIFIYYNLDLDICDEMLDELNSVDNFKNYSKFRGVFNFIPLEE